MHPRSTHTALLALFRHRHVSFITIGKNAGFLRRHKFLENLVETGVIIHTQSKWLCRKCSHPAIQLNGGVGSVDIYLVEHDLVSNVKAQPSHDLDMWMFPDGPL